LEKLYEEQLELLKSDDKAKNFDPVDEKIENIKKQILNKEKGINNENVEKMKSITSNSEQKTNDYLESQAASQKNNKDVEKNIEQLPSNLKPKDIDVPKLLKDLEELYEKRLESLKSNDEFKDFSLGDKKIENIKKQILAEKTVADHDFNVSKMYSIESDFQEKTYDHFNPQKNNDNKINNNIAPKQEGWEFLVNAFEKMSYSGKNNFYNNVAKTLELYGEIDFLNKAFANSDDKSRSDVFKTIVQSNFRENASLEVKIEGLKDQIKESIYDTSDKSILDEAINDVLNIKQDRRKRLEQEERGNIESSQETSKLLKDFEELYEKKFNLLKDGDNEKNEIKIRENDQKTYELTDKIDSKKDQEAEKRMDSIITNFREKIYHLDAQKKENIESSQEKSESSQEKSELLQDLGKLYEKQFIFLKDGDNERMSHNDKKIENIKKQILKEEKNIDNGINVEKMDSIISDFQKKTYDHFNPQKNNYNKKIIPDNVTKIFKSNTQNIQNYNSNNQNKNSGGIFKNSGGRNG